MDPSFQEEARSLEPFLRTVRRQLHAHPELSGAEWDTCAFIRRTLSDLGIAPDQRFAPPNTVALLQGGQPGPTVALRADIDALPIQEKNEVPYRSQRDGIMHACGHDAHTAMLLGAAALLFPRMEGLRGSVKLIFQSAEEAPPGGAVGLIEQGVLQDPPVSMIFAQHVQAHIRCGQAAVYPGCFMAAADTLTIDVWGRSCHAAHPQRGVDAIWIAAQILTALQGLMGRGRIPAIGAVLSMCRIQGGEKSNILADHVCMEGTLRTLDEALRRELKARIQTLSEQTAALWGGRCDVSFCPGYPCVCNDGAASARMAKAQSKILGEENIVSLPYPSTGSEDFAWYQQSCPGVMANLGCGAPERGMVSSIHTPTFDIDESCLPLGAAILAQCAWDFLNDLPENS